MSSQLLVPNVLSVSCKRFLSYIYFVGFSIAQNTKSERLDVVSPLKLCLLSQTSLPPSGKSPDVALATVPLPSTTPHGLSVLYLALSFSASGQPRCVYNSGPCLGRSKVLTLPCSSAFFWRGRLPGVLLCSPLSLPHLWRKPSCYRPSQRACQTDFTPCTFLNKGPRDHGVAPSVCCPSHPTTLRGIWGEGARVSFVSWRDPVGL